MSSEYLLNDCCGWAELFLNENQTNKRLMTFRGKFQEADVVNKNKRLYPFSTLAENVKRLMQFIEDNGGLLGELDHPNDSIIHFKDASHKITKLWWEDKVLMGEAIVLNTPAGMVLRNLLEDGVKIGVSSRSVGNGTTNENGVLVVSPSLRIVSFDAVADPSTPGAFQERVVKAQKEQYEQPTMTESVKPNADVLISYFGSLLESKLRNRSK